MSLRLFAPLPLAVAHRLGGFACGEATLDEWLKRRAMANQLSGASRTFVVADQDDLVFGYYATARALLRTSRPPAPCDATCPTRSPSSS